MDELRKISYSWKTVPIFISSTFNDMHAERDQLIKVVFPYLREKLEKCGVDTHWWFGWWVRCHEDCTLQWRRKGSEEEWSDAGVVPGGSVKWSENMEYRCMCR